jgi:hypothetical protein
MIRKCTKEDLGLLNKYLYQRKELNLFIIGDIENLGFDNKDMEVFMDFDQKINTIYLRFFTNLCIVSYDKILDLKFVENLIEKESILNISGEKELLCLLHLEKFKRKDCLFASLNELSIEVDCAGVCEVGLDRVPELIEKSNKIFKTETSIDSTKMELENNSKHIFTFIKDNQIISSASTSAECSDLAMIIGVFTLEEYRRQGYALKCVYALCEKLLHENKTVCLFYDNPNAAEMYEKIGFKFLGYFSILRKD